MNGKTSRKIRKEVNKQAFDQFNFAYDLLNAQRLHKRIYYALRLIFGKL